MVNESAPAVALVTGGAQRIGAAICRDLAAHGWSVAVHHNRARKPAERLAEEIASAGGRAMTVGSDFTDALDLTGVFPRIAEVFGPVTLLVNNAASFVRDEFGALDRATWDNQLAVNLTAPIFLAEAFAAQLPDDVEGNVVNILDQRVLKPLPVYASYQLSKSALHTATQTMAQAYAPRIRVHGLGPGPTLAHSGQPSANFEREIANVPLKRGAELAEFGRAIRFFVDNRSLTGQTIALDGGQHLAWDTPDQAVID